MMYSRNDPAPSVSHLLSFLREEETRCHKTYAYRGQVREYDFPLLPSLYREFVRTDVRPIQHAKLSGGCGDTVANVFMPLGLVDFTALLSVKRMPPDELSQIDPALSAPNTDVGLRTLKTFAGVLLKQAGIGGTQEEILVSLLTENPHPAFTDKHGVIDRVCRHIIREKAAVLPYGRMVGEFLCQQYGITSGFLDATYSLDVAAFFATHRPPLFQPPLADEGLGVIYRFDVSNDVGGGIGVADKWPGYLGYDLCFAGLENEGCSHASMQTNLDTFLVSMASEQKDYGLLQVPPGSVAMSRIGRQESVMIVPGVVVRRVEQWGQAVVGVEDLRSRPGTETFYFRHSANDTVTTRLSRCWIWPGAGDVFKTWTAAMFLPNSPAWFGEMSDGVWVSIPKRLDLIDTGYAFTANCVANLGYLDSVSLNDARGIGLDPVVSEADRARVSSIMRRLMNVIDSELSTWDELMQFLPPDNVLPDDSGFLEQFREDIDFITKCIDAPSGHDLQLRAAAIVVMGLFVLRGSMLARENRDGVVFAVSYFITAAEIAEMCGYRKISLACRQCLAGYVSKVVIRSVSVQESEKAVLLLSCLDVLDEMLTVDAWHNTACPNKAQARSPWYRLREEIIGSLPAGIVGRVVVSDRIDSGPGWGLGSVWESALQRVLGAFVKVKR